MEMGACSLRAPEGKEGDNRFNTISSYTEFEARLDLKLCLKQLHHKTQTWWYMTVALVLKLFRAILDYM